MNGSVSSSRSARSPLSRAYHPRDLEQRRLGDGRRDGGAGTRCAALRPEPEPDDLIDRRRMQHECRAAGALWLGDGGS
jgi:hypothetical protein